METISQQIVNCNDSHEIILKNLQICIDIRELLHLDRWKKVAYKAITNEKSYNLQLKEFGTLDSLVTKWFFSYRELDARKHHILYYGKDSFK